MQEKEILARYKRASEIIDANYEASNLSEKLKLLACLQEAVYIFNGSDISNPICSECLKNCTVQTVNDGEGLTESWGQVENHRKIVEVSDCHEADVL
jgi:hypothetical protein